MMLSRAEKLVPQRSHDFMTRLCVVVAGDVDQVVRPAALTVVLGQTIQQHTQFGRTRILSPAHKTDIRSEGDAVIIEQPDTSILVDQQGSVRIITVAPSGSRHMGRRSASSKKTCAITSRSCCERWIAFSRISIPSGR